MAKKMPACKQSFATTANNTDSSKESKAYLA